MSYKTLDEIRKRLVEINPLFDEVDGVQRTQWREFGQEGVLCSDPFRPTIENFYMTDVISRHSVTMARCTQEILADKQRIVSYD